MTFCRSASNSAAASPASTGSAWRKLISWRSNSRKTIWMPCVRCVKCSTPKAAAIRIRCFQAPNVVLTSRRRNKLPRELACNEQVMKATADQYRLLFEANPQPMWVYDLETLRFLAVNDGAIKHYGYSRDEFLAMTIKDIRPPEEVARLVEHLPKMQADHHAMGVW